MRKSKFFKIREFKLIKFVIAYNSFGKFKFDFPQLKSGLLLGSLSFCLIFNLNTPEIEVIELDEMCISFKKTFGCRQQ